jgi:hypothetical protein
MPVLVDRGRGPVLAGSSGMTCFRCGLAVLVLMAAACGGATNGDGGGVSAGGNGGSAGGAGGGGGAAASDSSPDRIGAADAGAVDTGAPAVDIVCRQSSYWITN